MYSVNHALIATGLASMWTSNLLLAFIIGFGSHFLADIIPHGDTPVDFRRSDRRFDPPPSTPKSHHHAMVASLIDLLLLFGIVIWLASTKSNVNWPVFSAALFGGIFPDLAWGAIELLRLRRLEGFSRIHHRIHNLIPFDFSMRVGLTLQILLAVLLLTIIYN